MAEVRKKEKVEKYNIDEITIKESKKKISKKLEKKSKKKVAKKNVKEEKRSLWVKFRIFCHGVKTEFIKIHWPSKNDMVRYSVASIFFIIFCALFFYLIIFIFAFFIKLFN